MSIVDVDRLLQEVAGDAPSGQNLEYDPAFLELEQSALGKPEVQYGATIVPAVPPEWKLVKQQALGLFERTHDLRVAMPLVRALLNLHAMPGFADGLHLVTRLVGERWTSIHPELDADDGDDPTLRINSLAALADSATILRELRDTPFVVLPGLGPLSLRMLEQANGEAPAPEGQSAPAIDSIHAALADVADDALRAAVQAVVLARDSVASLEAGVVRQVGSTQAPNLDALARQLRRMDELLASRAAAPAAGAVTGADASTAAQDAFQAGAAARAPAAISGDIATRADVVRMIDKILAYYQRHEPSSPVPMLLERARRLAPMSFMEVMEDLAPDSLSQLQVIRGPLPDQSEQSDY